MKVFVPVFVLLLAAGCTRQFPSGDREPQKAEPLSAVEVAARMAAMEAASVTGDRDEVKRQMTGLQDDVRRAMKLPDPTRRIDHEAARAVVRKMPGVHSVAWLDRENLLVMVEKDALRSQQTIDAICLRLEPLGDTLGVIVNLKTRDATQPEERGTLSRNCQLAPGDVAFMQKPHATYDPPPEVVAAFHAAQRPQSDEDRKVQEEVERILEASTPKM